MRLWGFRYWGFWFVLFIVFFVLCLLNLRFWGTPAFLSHRVVWVRGLRATCCAFPLTSGGISLGTPGLPLRARGFSHVGLDTCAGGETNPARQRAPQKRLRRIGVKKAWI